LERKWGRWAVSVYTHYTIGSFGKGKTINSSHIDISVIGRFRFDGLAVESVETGPASVLI
jgi:hypothetical protein